MLRVTEILSHDIVRVVSGIAGARTAIEAARVSSSKTSIAVVTKCKLFDPFNDIDTVWYRHS